MTNALLACGNVDPADNMQQAGTGGDNASAGDGAGAVGAEGGAGPSGGSSGAAGAPDMQPDGALLPWAVGNTWTYQVTDAMGVVSEKTTIIGDEEEIGGTGPNAALLAFHVTTTKGTNGNDHTESWQGPSPDEPLRIVRYREQSFGAATGALELEEHWDPAKLHIDGTPEHTVTGASWLEAYFETKLYVGMPASDPKEERDVWSVVSDDETLEVPAGTFDHVIHFKKTGTIAAGTTPKEYWYLRGVGKLKETGNQTEELVDYTIEGQTP